jgi:uncharacterized membrane protein
MRYLTALIVMAPLMGAGLVACTPEIASQEPAAASSATTDIAPPLSSGQFGGVDLRAPLSLVGTEPFWAVKIADGAAILSRMDQVEASYSVGDFTVSDTAATVQSGDLSIVLTAVTCSDGMSDRVYPLTAEVRVGDETLKGCAIATAEMMANPV